MGDIGHVVRALDLHRIDEGQAPAEAEVSVDVREVATA